MTAVLTSWSGIPCVVCGAPDAFCHVTDVVGPPDRAQLLCSACAGWAMLMLSAYLPGEIRLGLQPGVAMKRANYAAQISARNGPRSTPNLKVDHTSSVEE